MIQKTSILLKAGFSVAEGVSFQAFIDGCNEAMIVEEKY